MAEIQGTNLSSSPSYTNFSKPNNGIRLAGKIYLFAPASSSTKLNLLLILAIVGIVALLGNTLILCFQKTRKRANYFLRACCFEKNFNFYIQSLAISDILSVAISLPAVCIQMYVDLFQQGWGCKIVRYLNFVFPTITINNLLVISIEKYFSTRKTPRAFSHTTVKILVFIAWSAGFLSVLITTPTFKGMRYDLNDTHYTVICEYDNQYLPFRIVITTYATLEYIFPSCLIIPISISLVKTVRTRTRQAVDVQQGNAITSARKAAQIRSTCIIVTLMFAFFIPYMFYFTLVIYNMVCKERIGVETYYIIRIVSALIALSNSAINVIIYLVQMKNFRSFLKRQLISRFFGENANPAAPGPARLF